MEGVPGSPVLADLTDDHLSLTLNAPGSSNALSPLMVETMIEMLENSSGARSCTINAAGRNFCAGFDLSDLDALSDGDLLHRFLRIETLLQRIHHAPFPVMAMCHGAAIGAGADLVAACWKRIAAPGARFRMPGWNFELALGTRRLARLIGSDAARDLLIDTRQIDANEALSLGLVSGIAERDEWSGLVEAFRTRSRVLSDFASPHMLALTRTDTRAEDMAGIVATAGRPGLKARIEAYGASVAAARKTRKKEV